ncbi:flagellar hook-basal body complex protein FliE [Pseudomonas citronellolis]|uniref:flagellar hook-basal body complex protein FliE n=1 Tax=Pseudomonas citronellolis TaxID=53408 RepID=UPI0023E45797|nr:flagellar hook-basal body complex protein FliE [Pseudomonas citronellolis]MDF3933856.1 flagellar hook-basal body complex protein FliE [Pseudomonas citronellolis]
MNPIEQARSDMLGQMQQLSALSAAPIRPAMQVEGAAAEPGFGNAFEDALRAVDAQQHQASEAAAAVDSGRSDDLAGAMIESQKASVSFSALMQVRNKLTTAFDQVMNMPL